MAPKTSIFQIKKDYQKKNNLSSWTTKEDYFLCDLATSKLECKWKLIAEIMKNKSAYQCKYRFTRLRQQNFWYLRQISRENNKNIPDILKENKNVKSYFDSSSFKENLKDFEKIIIRRKCRRNKKIKQLQKKIINKSIERVANFQIENDHDSMRTITETSDEEMSVVNDKSSLDSEKEYISNSDMLTRTYESCSTGDESPSPRIIQLFLKETLLLLYNNCKITEEKVFHQILINFNYYDYIKNFDSQQEVLKLVEFLDEKNFSTIDEKYVNILNFEESYHKFRHFLKLIDMLRNSAKKEVECKLLCLQETLLRKFKLIIETFLESKISDI